MKKKPTDWDENTPTSPEQKRKEAMALLNEADWEENSQVAIHLAPGAPPKVHSIPGPAKGVAHVLGVVPSGWRGPIVVLIVLAMALGAKSVGLF